MTPLGKAPDVSDVPDVINRYVADFRAFAANGAGGAPSWLKEIREGAIARFAQLGFPTTKQEAWRFGRIQISKGNRGANGTIERNSPFSVTTRVRSPLSCRMMSQ